MKNLKHYLNLPYTIVLRRDEEGDIVARVEELKGCSAHGKTHAEAIANLEEAMEAWISDCVESGDPVPEPSALRSLPSGKWVQRVPRTIHRRLTELAKQEGVSLNQLVTSLLSEALGSVQKEEEDLQHEATESHTVWKDLLCGEENWTFIMPKTASDKKAHRLGGVLWQTVGTHYRTMKIAREAPTENYEEEHSHEKKEGYVF